jgi:hypothetical protein
MAHFFPDATTVAEARARLAGGHYGDLDLTMNVGDLARPHTRQTKDMIAEFRTLADELGLRESDSTGFIVLVPVVVNGSSLTTPVLVDVDHEELSFTSHPTFGAGAIPDDVLSANPALPPAIREQLLGVLATWHNPATAERET